jgi:hypothetical protein
LFPAILALSACGDPLADIARLDEIDVAGPAPVVEAVAAPEETNENVGLFQRLMRKRQVAPEADANIAAPSGAAGAAPKAPVETDAAQAVDAVEETPRKDGWLFGLTTRSKKPGAELAAPEAEKLPLETVQQASLPAPNARARPQGAGADKGLFSRQKAARLTGPDARTVAPGEVLPFGEIARACHIKRGQMGKEVAKYPERGAKYRVYDSALGNVGLHTFYVTGFKDGCPRQFTAALAVFGSAGMYEALRYGLPVKARSKKPTDKAYETVKSRVCGVARSKPCGAKVSRLEKSTVFLSLYNRFEGAQGWTNLLLSDGNVMAKDVQG